MLFRISYLRFITSQVTVYSTARYTTMHRRITVTYTQNGV